jgi:hypothetical protein
VPPSLPLSLLQLLAHALLLLQRLPVHLPVLPLLAVLSLLLLLLAVALGMG